MDRKEWRERKAKLDAQIMAHPFLNDFTKAQRNAAENKETLPLLANYGRHSKKERKEKKISAPIIEGFTQEQVEDYWDKRQSLLNILMEQQGIQRLIRKAIYQDWEQACDPDDEIQEDQAGSCRSREAAEEDEGQKGSFQILLGDAKTYLGLNAQNKWCSFDGVSYTKAVREAICSYNAQYRNEKKQTKASFVNLLASCYAHQLNRTQQEQINIAQGKLTVSKQSIRVLTAVADFLDQKQSTYTLETIPQGSEAYQALIEYVSETTDMERDEVCRLLPILQRIRTGSLDGPAGSEGDGNKQELVPDPVVPQNLTQDKLEKQDLAFRFLQAVSKKKMKEYNQLLMTNLILQPIHPKAGCVKTVPGSKKYADQLRQNSAGLYKMVFHLPYLNYIEWRKPKSPQQKADPARIEVLCDGYPLKDLNAKSVAEYKEVTPANVTYYSKRFAEYLEEIAEQELDITD